MNLADNTYHYFASNCYTWMVDADLESLIKRMRKDRKQCAPGRKLHTVFYIVPGDADTTMYDIKFYQPCVVGTEAIYVKNI